MPQALTIIKDVWAEGIPNKTMANCGVIGYFDKRKYNHAPFYFITMPGERRPVLLLNYEIYKHINEALGEPGLVKTKEWAPDANSSMCGVDYRELQEARVGAYRCMENPDVHVGIISYMVMREQWII